MLCLSTTHLIWKASLAPGQALDTLLEMKAEGVVRHIGAGVRSHEFHRELIETGHIDIILTFLDYTLLSQSAAETTLPLARQHDVGIILASPLGMGSLTGVEPDLETERRRNPNARFDMGAKAHAMWQWCQEPRCEYPSSRDAVLPCCADRRRCYVRSPPIKHK